MGLVAATSPYNRRGCISDGNSLLTWRLKVWIALQAILGAVRLYLNYVLLAYLPLGDAVTIMFVEPLFTVFLSFILLRISASIWKILLCIGLLVGMILTVQPPFIFGKMLNGSEDSNSTRTELTEDVKHEMVLEEERYYEGVFMALSCAIMGALCNIFITKCEKIRSTVLVFYGGAFGIIVALLGWIIDPESSKILTKFEALGTSDWLLLCMISMIGIVAILAMTAALKMISPTSVSVLKALEIIFAFLFQIIVMHQWPNVLCIVGATLVSGSIIGISIEERYSNNQQEMQNLFNSARHENRRNSPPRLVQIGHTCVLMRGNNQTQ